MNPQAAEKILKVLFRLNALLLMSALLAMFLPIEWMSQTHEFLGLGEFPNSEITEYLARSCSMLYAIHGFVLFAVSLDLRRYWSAVPLLAGLHGFMGAIMLGIDLKAGMPWYWTAAEGPGIMIFAGVLLWLWKKADQQQPAAVD